MAQNFDEVKVLKALANKTRLKFIQELQSNSKGLSPSHFADLLSIPFMTVCFHLNKLLLANIVHRHDHGISTIYSINQTTLDAIKQYLNKSL